MENKKNIYGELWGESTNTESQKREQEKRYKAIDEYNKIAFKIGDKNLMELNGDLINKDGVY